MMSRWYFVTHPNIEMTAKVHAPSSEKARTAYLDFLERSGRINRNQRQDLRRNTMVDFLDDPNAVTADIEIPYEYVEEPMAPFYAGEAPVQGMQPEEIVQGEPVPVPQQMSPLQKLVLTGKVD